MSVIIVKKVILNDEITNTVQPVVVMGREAELKDYLGDKMYVSRQHAKLTVVAGKVLIENLSNTNRTFKNNKPIAGFHFLSKA